MKKRALNLLTLVSLLLCATLMFLATRSFFGNDRLWRLKADQQGRGVTYTSLDSMCGYVLFSRRGFPGASSDLMQQEYHAQLQRRGVLSWRFSTQPLSLKTLNPVPGLFYFHHYRNTGLLQSGTPWGAFELSIPYGPLILWFAMLPVIRGRTLLRQRRRRLRGECEECGYDLRASKNRCPECGTEHGPPPNVTQ